MHIAGRLIRSATSRVKRRLVRPYLRLANDGLTLGPGADVYNSTFGRLVRLGRGTEVAESHVGDYSYLGPGCTVVRAKIGKFCSVARDVEIGLGSHPSRDFVSTHPIFYLARPAHGWNLTDRDMREEFATTVIGNDVWIGARALIKGGVTIGDGAIVGAGAVVTRDVPPYTIYVGVPAKLLRHRFDSDQITTLLSVRWWDWDEERLRSNAVDWLDINTFIEKLKVAE